MTPQSSWPEARSVFILTCIITILAVSVLMVNPHYPYVQGFPVATPHSPQVQIGDQIIVDVIASSAVDLVGAQIELRYDNSVLSLEDVIEGIFLSEGIENATFISESSDVSGSQTTHTVIIVLLNDSGVHGSGVLATFEFDAIESGDGNIQLHHAILANSDAQPTSGTVSIDVSVSSEPVVGQVPVISNLAPSGTLHEGPQDVQLTATTDIQALCRFSTSSSTGFSSMTPFSQTNDTAHAHTLTNQQPGSFSYYVRCRDSGSSLTSSSQSLSFTIPQFTPPTLSQLAPTGTLPQGTTNTILSLTTSTLAQCRFSISSSTVFESRTPFTNTNSTLHNHTVSGLSAGSHTYFVRCQDLDTEALSANTAITFSIAAPQQSTPPSTGGGGGGGAPPVTGGGGGFIPRPAPEPEMTLQIDFTHETTVGVARASAEFTESVPSTTSIRVQSLPLTSELAPQTDDVSSPIMWYSAGTFSISGTEQTASTFSFTVRVEREWLSREGVDENDVIVFGYANGSWSPRAISSTSLSTGYISITSTGEFVERYAVGFSIPQSGSDAVITPEVNAPQTTQTTNAQRSERSALHVLASVLLLFSLLALVAGIVVIRGGKPPQLRL